MGLLLEWEEGKGKKSQKIIKYEGRSVWIESNLG